MSLIDLRLPITSMIFLKTFQTELKIEQNELHKKPKMNLDAAEG
jgi:hypothetical protein